MIHVLFNALASTAGGGVTYLRNVLPLLNDCDEQQRYLVLLPQSDPEHRLHLTPGKVTTEVVETGGLLQRLWWEQSELRNLIRSRRI
ncbi:MAG: hypothetical protein JNK38_05780, partial [Acidobacteria bacterium]|nr:hypothetical protein [Acidobacteriota bacterium]